MSFIRIAAFTFTIIFSSLNAMSMFTQVAAVRLHAIETDRDITPDFAPVKNSAISSQSGESKTTNENTQNVQKVAFNVKHVNKSLRSAVAENKNKSDAPKSVTTPASAAAAADNRDCDCSRCCDCSSSFWGIVVPVMTVAVCYGAYWCDQYKEPVVLYYSDSPTEYEEVYDYYH